MRRRLEILANQSGLCPGCIQRKHEEEQRQALAQRVHQNVKAFLAERTPANLRTEAQRLLDQAAALEATDGGAASGPSRYTSDWPLA